MKKGNKKLAMCSATGTLIVNRLHHHSDENISVYYYKNVSLCSLFFPVKKKKHHYKQISFKINIKFHFKKVQTAALNHLQCLITDLFWPFLSHNRLANKQDKMNALLGNELIEILSLEKLVNQSRSLCHIVSTVDQ